MEEPILECSQIKKLLVKEIDKVLKPIGFSREKVKWTLRGQAVTHVLSLQKSSWDLSKYECSYYLNIKLWLVDLEPSPDCWSELSGRIQSIPGSPKMQSVDFEHVDEKAALCTIAAAIQVLSDWYLPWVNKYQTFEALQQSFRDGVFISFGVQTHLQYALRR
jgi:hypothetical protein